MSVNPEQEGFEQDPTGIVSREELIRRSVHRVGDPVPARVPEPVSPALAPVAEPEPVAVVPPAAPAPAEVPEQRYVWQPKDETGRPIGGRQVYVYKASTPLPQEVLDQVTKGHEMAIRALRKTAREKELGPEKDDAEKFSNPVEFKSRDLSADERFALAQKLQNPETTPEAIELLSQAVFGAKPSVLVTQLNETQKFMIQQRAVDSYVEFATSTPEYFDSPSNRLTITQWMGKRNWNPTPANFNRAFQHLAGQVGLLETAPEVHQVPPVIVPAPVAAPVTPVATAVNTQPPAAATPGLASTPPQEKRHSHVPSGLTPTVASVQGSTPVEQKMTVADLEKIPSDVLKARLRDPKFRQAADEAYAEADRQARARQLARSNVN